MRMLIVTLSFALLLGATSVSHGGYVVVDQIGAVFNPVVNPSTGGTIALSLYDTSASEVPFPGAHQRHAFSTAYDNFSYASAGTTSTFEWVGSREDTNLADPGSNFKIAIYADNAGAPPAFGSAALSTFTVSTGISALANDYNLYTANANFNFAANTNYWVAITNTVDYNVNGWGLAYSNMGTLGPNASYQDYEPDSDIAMSRFSDSLNYAMRISAVPEPGSAVACLIGLGLVTFRRRRA